jgi:hypothetical protein
MLEEYFSLVAAEIKAQALISNPERKLGLH